MTLTSEFTDLILESIFPLFDLISSSGSTCAKMTSFTVKVVPYPSILSTVTVPPIFSIILLQMLRPKPVPWAFTFECSSSFPKSINSLERFSFLIPTPVSEMSIFNLIYLNTSSSYFEDSIANASNS